MKRTAIIILILTLGLFMLSACGRKTSVGDTAGNNLQGEIQSTESGIKKDETQLTDGASEESELNTEEKTMKLKITVNGKVFFAELNDSTASHELYDMLPFTVDMTELNGNEKYYYLSDRLTRDDKKVGRIETGDIMLYSGNCLVVFYDSFSTVYSYTPLGKITDPAGLKDALGKDNVTVSFEIAD